MGLLARYESVYVRFISWSPVLKTTNEYSETNFACDVEIGHPNLSEIPMSRDPMFRVMC